MDCRFFAHKTSGCSYPLNNAPAFWWSVQCRDLLPHTSYSVPIKKRRWPFVNKEIMTERKHGFTNTVTRTKTWWQCYAAKYSIQYERKKLLVAVKFMILQSRKKLLKRQIFFKVMNHLSSGWSGGIFAEIQWCIIFGRGGVGSSAAFGLNIIPSLQQLPK